MKTKVTNGWISRTTVLAGSALVLACASVGPSAELVDARRSYDQARVGEAGRLVPDKVVDARRALEHAEVAHRDEPGSKRERDLAYVALRQAQLAMANAALAAERLALARAERAYQDELKRIAGAKSAQLDAKEKSLTQTRGQLDTANAQLREKERQLVRGQDELAASKLERDSEREARQKAENEARAALQSLERIAQIRQEQQELIITLSGEVLFEFNRAVLLPIARERLAEVATALKDLDGGKIVVEGHTDSKGSDAVNQGLSQARAEAVVAFLVSQGVSPDRLRAVGKGESEPVANNRTAEGRANNRRVEIHVGRPAEVSHW